MPLFLQKIIAPDCILAVWHITETNDELKLLLSKDFFELNMQLRIDHASARHYLASRVLLSTRFNNMSVHLHKNEFNKPMLEINGIPYHVSITHSHQFAGIMFSKTMELGLDLEKIDTRINRVAHKFMNDEETRYAGNETDIEKKTIIWSAKETLYKIYGKKELDFKLHLHINKFDLKSEGIIASSINKGDYNNKINLHYQCFEDFVLTYAVKEVNCEL